LELKRSVIDESDVEPPEGETGDWRLGRLGRRGEVRASKEGPAIEVQIARVTGWK
jgi:hypothetical protein